MNNYRYVVKADDTAFAPVIAHGQMQARDEKEAIAVLTLNLRSYERLYVTKA